ncbi:MAG: UbiA family prenyltransferase [Anaerolineales bacterium]|nr:UbiA family prenyltransferase [Anaerolineales bacterium]
MNSIRPVLKSLIQSARVPFLAAAVTAYALGIAIASYLAVPVDWPRFWWGLLFVFSMHLFTRWIEAGFLPSSLNPSSLADTPANNLKTAKTSRTFLFAAFFSLAMMGTSLSGFLLNGTLPAVSWLLLSILILSTILYTVPPYLIQTAGIDEIWSAFLICALVPAFSYSLMAEELHRLIPMSTTALAAFFFASLIVSQLRTYAKDTAAERKTLATRLGWRKIMFLHDAALEFGVFSLALAYIFGYPSRISLSLLIVLPLILIQMIQMNRIRQGAPPGFRAMQATASAIFSLTLYFQFIGFLH